MNEIRKKAGGIAKDILGKNYRRIRMPLAVILPLAGPETTELRTVAKSPVSGGQAASKVKSVSNPTLRGNIPASRGISELAYRNLALFFDADYYKAQTGIIIDDFDKTLDHYIKYGMKAKLVPHCLISFDYLPQSLQSKYLKGDVDAFVTFLASKASARIPSGPLLDLSGHPEGHKSTCVLDFLLTLKRNRVLPVSLADSLGGSVEYGDALDRLSSALLLIRGQKKLHGESMTKSWDVEAEKHWKLEVQSNSASVVQKYRDCGPAVSIVMPVWNRPEAVLTAIRSVQAQSWVAWELIIVDDGSTDNTVSVIREQAKLDPRIRLLENAHEGVCAARNAGIDAAEGNFVAFLDSDNTWRSDFLMMMLTSMDSSDKDCAFSAVKLVGKESTRYLGVEFVPEQLLIRNYVDMNTLVVRRLLLIEIDGFDTRLRRMVDHDLIIRLGQKTKIHFLPFIGCDYHDLDTSSRISTNESPNWMHAVLGKNVVDWQQIEAGLVDRQSDLLSIVIVMANGVQSVMKTIRSVIRHNDDKNFEIIVIDNDSNSSRSLEIVSATLADNRVRIVRLRKNYGFATGANMGFQSSRGSVVIFLQPGMIVRNAALEKIVDDLRDQSILASQPLVMDLHGTISSAGSVIPAENGVPINFLEGLPLQDALKFNELAVSGVTSVCFSIRADDFFSVGGFDPIFFQGFEDADFSARLGRSDSRKILVNTESLVVRSQPVGSTKSKQNWLENRDLYLNRHRGSSQPDAVQLLKAAGFDLIAVRPGLGAEAQRDQLLVSRMKEGDQVSMGSETPRLRWAIKIGAAFTEGQDLWGDVFFAEDLATSLRKLGQDVVIDRAGAFHRDSAYLDDVTLTIRGFAPFEPQAGRLNLMWVISRPDTVVAKELRRFDHVFAASEQWSRSMTLQSGVPIEVMLQATNPERFHGLSVVAYPQSDIVFVGGPRPPIGRKIVLDAREQGAEVDVWGPRWNQFLPQESIKGDFLSNDYASGVYRTSRLVLNDHFQDMQDNGFINNRLFDAVASGGRVVSDHIEGIEDLFLGAVRTYQTRSELKELLDSDNHSFPSNERLQEISGIIREEHSFDVRAKRLLEVALNKLGR